MAPAIADLAALPRQALSLQHLSVGEQGVRAYLWAAWQAA